MNDFFAPQTRSTAIPFREFHSRTETSWTDLEGQHYDYRREESLTSSNDFGPHWRYRGRVVESPDRLGPEGGYIPPLSMHPGGSPIRATRATSAAAPPPAQQTRTYIVPTNIKLDLVVIMPPTATPPQQPPAQPPTNNPAEPSYQPAPAQPPTNNPAEPSYQPAPPQAAGCSTGFVTPPPSNDNASVETLPDPHLDINMEITDAGNFQVIEITWTGQGVIAEPAYNHEQRKLSFLHEPEAGSGQIKTRFTIDAPVPRSTAYTRIVPGQGHNRWLLICTKT
ncbi:hypothetical protein H4R33_006070 [Dimargaris cristalligena]|nr:hypothetical protein H4R33_006070 [Dimargaris cristalligena]